jgi:hypothetical protein
VLASSLKLVPPLLSTTTLLHQFHLVPINVGINHYEHEDGTVVHPSITKHENLMDIMLLRALIVEQTFDAL